jgi:7,8-dihydropterin-6-yl-methyl-4-(beta-D-ribofuranosyl)aminobenzene 5'-phosphate synthase
MRVTSLIENSRIEGRDDLEAEFGLSVHVEANGTTVLFDMGASDNFARNAEALNLDIADTELAAVSHQHFDHGGGLEHFLETNQRAPVYLRESPVSDRWFKALVVLKRSIGLDPEVFERFADRIEFVDETRAIATGIYLLTGIGSIHPRPQGNRRLFVESNGALVPDPFDHELMMVIHENDGMVVFSGCSHNGILNMIDAATAEFPRVPIKAVFGGFHLIGLPFYNSMAASRSEVRDIGLRILENVRGTVYTGHCTGQKAFSVLKEVMGDALQLFPTGASVEV